jgi:hypothetical protein
VLEEVDEPVLMELAARTLGRLVKSGAALTSEIVDREVRVVCVCVVRAPARAPVCLRRSRFLTASEPPTN